MDDVLWYSELSKHVAQQNTNMETRFTLLGVEVVIEKQEQLPNACEHTTPYNMTGARLQH